MGFERENVPALDVSVVIPTFNRKESLKRLLRALSNQTLPPNSYEVLVTIDGSMDGTREFLTRFSPPYSLRTYWQPNRGRACARNAALRAAHGRLIVFFDDDMEPTPRCLASHASRHSQERRCCVTGPVPIVLDQPPSPLQLYIRDKFKAHHRRLSIRGHAHLRDFYGGNFSVPQTLIREVGLFDETFDVYGNEDLEFAARLRDAGAHFVFDQRAIAKQRWEKTFPELARDTFAKGRTVVLLAAKHPGAKDELRIADYHRGTWMWRTMRACLLSASRVPRFSRGVTKFTLLLERVRFPRMRLYYMRVLDYFFWLGVRAALSDHGYHAPLRTVSKNWPARAPNHRPLYR